MECWSIENFEVSSWNIGMLHWEYWKTEYILNYQSIEERLNVERLKSLKGSTVVIKTAIWNCIKISNLILKRYLCLVASIGKSQH